MNKEVLTFEVQNFIKENEDTDQVSLLLKKQLFKNVSNKELVQQIASRKKCKKKLSLWFRTNAIYYPNKLNIEQTSSENTARYKGTLVDGESLLDLTGGFGVDSYYFSKRIAKVVHCEINPDLSQIARHNYSLLGARAIEIVQGDGIEFLKQTTQNFNWIYVDPSRRDRFKGKVFRLSDCTPDLLKNLEILFEKSNNILVKTSPLLDLSLTIKQLSGIREVHILSLENEVKEVLWVLKKGYSGLIKVKTRNDTKHGNEAFDFIWKEELKASQSFSEPLDYIYEPNVAIMKSGAFKTVANRFKLPKLHPNTHLYTSENLLNFPGRVFKLKECLPYTKRNLRQLQGKKAHVTTRNFKETVAQIRKKHRIKEGGDQYLFFTSQMHGKPVVLICSKVVGQPHPGSSFRAT